MNALLYIRVSTEEQVKYGYSLDAQEKALREWCDNNNYIVKKVYADEGISGGSIEKRKALQKMISDSLEGEIIIFTKLDRFSRNLLDANIIVKELDKKGVGIKAINEDDIDTTSADGRFIFNLKLSLAQREREKTSERIRDVNTYKKAQGEIVNGATPLGYKIVDKHFVINEETKDIALFIFNCFDKTNNLDEVHRQLLDKYGISRHRRTIKNHLLNTVYIGERYGNTRYCEPLIDRDLFERVGKRLAMNPRQSKNNHVYLFSKMIICPLCGNRIYAQPPRRETFATYYRCGNRRYGQCEFKSLREDRIEEQMLDKIKIFADREKYRLKKQKTIDYSSEIKSLKSKLSRLTELYIDGDIDKETYNNRKSAFEQRLNEISATNTVQENKALDTIIEMDIREIYNALTRENKRTFWLHYVDKIEVDVDGNVTDISFVVQD